MHSVDYECLDIRPFWLPKCVTKDVWAVVGRILGQEFEWHDGGRIWNGAQMLVRMELQSNWFPSPTFPVDSYAKVGDLIMFDDAMPKFSPNVFNGFGTHKVVGCPPPIKILDQAKRISSKPSPNLLSVGSPRNGSWDWARNPLFLKNEPSWRCL